MEQPTSYGFRLGYKFEEHKDREVGVNTPWGCIWERAWKKPGRERANSQRIGLQCNRLWPKCQTGQLF